ncbi:hypothetical protein MCAP1_001810 [Malassezia caprae]|uniref:Uncharacterized protein n=1 Tax=Malassezia caprae TaxID=1381934 RepID=A0AAF0EA86_9BASI|nr:hypothetical protein MCAP1_001810 [Malassezia caprae]
MAGDKVGDTLWSRIAQTVTNRPKVQAYAAARLLPYLRRAACHETLVKLGTYVLSEFGYLIADQPGAEPAVQFELLHRHAYCCSPVTRSMLLSTYAKWYTQYPSLSPTLASVLRQSRGVFHMEIHQRACEYTALMELHAQGVMNMDEIFDTLPPFSSQDLKPDDVGPGPFRLSKRLSTMPVVATVPRGEARQPTRADEARRRLPPILPPMSPTEVSVESMAIQSPSEACSDLLDLSSLSARPLSEKQEEAIQTPWAISEDNTMASPDGPLLGPVLAPAVTGAVVYDELRRLSLGHDSASSHDRAAVAPASHTLLHESTSERITYEIQARGPLVLVQVLVQNVDEAAALVVRDVQVSSPLDVRVHGATSSVSVEPGHAIEYTLELLCTACFLDDTELLLELASPSKTVPVRLPVSMAHFMEPYVLNKEAFFGQWRTMGSAHMETQSVFSLQTRTHSEYEAVMTASGLAVLTGIDPRPESLVMAGVLAPKGVSATCL